RGGPPPLRAGRGAAGVSERPAPAAPSPTRMGGEARGGRSPAHGGRRHGGGGARPGPAAFAVLRRLGGPPSRGEFVRPEGEAGQAAVLPLLAVDRDADARRVAEVEVELVVVGPLPAGALRDGPGVDDGPAGVGDLHPGALGRVQLDPDLLGPLPGLRGVGGLLRLLLAQRGVLLGGGPGGSGAPLLGRTAARALRAVRCPLTGRFLSPLPGVLLDAGL